MDHWNEPWQGNGKRVVPQSRHAWVQLIEDCEYSGKEIERRLGVRNGLLTHRLRKFGLRLRPKYRYRTQAQWDAILNQHRTLTEAAHHLGMKKTQLSKILIQRGIQHTFTDWKGRRKLEEIDTEDLVEILQSCGGVLQRASKVLGCFSTTLKKEMARRGVHVEPHRPKRLLIGFSDREILDSLMGKTYKEAARRLGCERTTIYSELRRRGLR